MTAKEIEALIEEAMLAPSVHNVQPARWRIESENGLILFEDTSRRLAAGDPTGHDAQISLGAAAEGLRVAASRRGLAVEEETTGLPVAGPLLVPVARYRMRDAGLPPDHLAGLVDARSSWRGAFLPPTAQDRKSAAVLAGPDAVVLSDPAILAELATSFDTASYGFMRNKAFRDELVSWMRLSPRHPRWARDGLNADAMAMGRIEAFGAGIVLGAAFRQLDRLRIAPTLLAEGKKVAQASAIVVFHRAVGEPPLVSGGSFYRLWLRIEAAGFGAAVLAALADDAEASRDLAARAGLGSDRRIVSAFRIGRRPPGAGYARARRPLAEILA